MNLDMYLTKKYYVKNWPHTPEEERWLIKIKRGNTVPIQVEKVIFINTEEIHWKDAYAIHLWFLKNILKGVEDKKEHPVLESKLHELLKTIDTVLKDKDKASKLLVTLNNKYDKEYYEVLKDTQVKLTELLNSSDEGEFYYSARK